LDNLNGETNAIDATKLKLFKATEAIAGAKGLFSLTLSEVAAAAGVSRGGLLYHFPTKTALLRGVLEYEISQFELWVRKEVGNDSSRGTWARAYIRTSFDERWTGGGPSSKALIRSLIIEPTLIATYGDHLDKWAEWFRADGLSETTAQLIRFAVEGLWFDEILGLRPLADTARKNFIDALINLTFEDKADSEKA
jgi:AcrR family transcriptional regulator